ncbi:MAG: RagB/SusD family nutrient uptake outer membrane protein [Petrimonas sp.]|jgi:tetratricopeptide (TPR) repeat protein
MKYYNIIISLIFATFLISFSSCDDFLDTLPDNRAELDSEDKIIKLLTSAYPNCSNVMLSEYWSDNIDNHDWNLNYNNFMDDLWHLKDQPNKEGNDTHFRSWERCYQAIASCNEAIQAIEEMGNPSSLKSAKAEALVARAWNHFELATLFTLPYGNSSSSDMGLPYMTKPETTVRPDYTRGTVEEFYQKIEADLEAGLPYIDDALHIQLKFHFNFKAANAFATKFYMTIGKFDKAIECATKVLGNNPAQVLRNWKATLAMDMNNSEQPDAYLDKSNPATLLVSYPISGWSTRGPNNYSTGNKFSHSMLLGKYETLQSRGPWGNHSNIYVRTWWNSNTNKLFHKKIGYYFEYTDPIARTGFQHTGYAHFTTDEVLLYRAEAYILTKQYSKAYEDLTMFITNYTNSQPTFESIISFYEKLPYHHYMETFVKNDHGIEELDKYPTPKKKLHPPLYQIEYNSEQEWLLHYVLHLRRILLLGEGQRWHDVRRYGITVDRRLVDRGHKVVELIDSMPHDDKRRAMQIPQEIINAGCPANPR